MHKQKIQSFSGVMKQENIELRMVVSNISLEIVIEDIRNLQIFRATIDNQFISKQGESFEKGFQKPQDIYHFLKKNSKKIVFEDSSLKFQYGKVNKNPMIACIPLNRQEIDDVKLSHLKIERVNNIVKLNSHRFVSSQIWMTVFVLLLTVVFAYSLYMASRQASELRLLLVQSQRQCRNNLTLIQYQHQQNIKHLSEKLEKLQNHHAFILQQQETAKRQFIQYTKSQQEKQNKLNDLLSSQMTLLRKEQKLLSGQLMIIENIGHLPESPHKFYYSVTATSATSVKVLKTISSGWHNFVNKFPILSSIKEISYKVKILKSSNQNMIGFTTEKGIGVMDNYHSLESVYYYKVGNGYLYEQGSQRQLSGPAVNVGDTVDVGVNFVTGKFQWLKGGTKVAECSIPAAMKDKPIYLSILIYDYGNEVEVFS